MYSLSRTSRHKYLRAAVEKILDEHLDEHGGREFLQIEIEERTDETYRQADRGRPTEKTEYITPARKRISFLRPGARPANRAQMVP
ncbi:MAG: hypothetical protein WDZ51_16350 [Pirellulaceae bacterium]